MLAEQRITYASSGVDMEKEDEAMELIKALLDETCSYRTTTLGKCVNSIPHFAGIVKLNDKLGLAMKTDGVGTKVFIAQLMQKYDTIGIDCVAMNVNDVICTGAEPISFVDYIAIQKPEPQIIRDIVFGLKEGAKIAGISISGGETAILPEMIKGASKDRGFDLAGMCIGIVELDKIIDGRSLEEGNVLLGLSSSGLHSNGYTMARRILLAKKHFSLNKHFDEFDRTLGEELLEPTFIYVPEIMEMIKNNIPIKLLAHITSRGFINLRRVGKKHGYIINSLPEPPPIFKLIQECGEVTHQDMYHTFNMGIGMCAVVSKNFVDDVIQIVEKHKKKVSVLGRVKEDVDRKIVIKPLKMVSDSKKNVFKKYA